MYQGHLYRTIRAYSRGDQLFLEKGQFWKLKKLEGHICRAKRGVFEGAKRPRKKGGSGGPPPENLYNWYANGANLGISGKFDLLLHSLAVAYFREHKNKIE